MSTVREVTRTAVRAQWPILLVFGIFFAAFGLVIADFWRRGSLLIGIGVGVAAVLRLTLPNGRAGLLVVRGRTTSIVLALSPAARRTPTKSPTPGRSER